MNNRKTPIEKFRYFACFFLEPVFCSEGLHHQTLKIYENDSKQKTTVEMKQRIVKLNFEGKTITDWLIGQT